MGTSSRPAWAAARIWLWSAAAIWVRVSAGLVHGRDDGGEVAGFGGEGLRGAGGVGGAEGRGPAGVGVGEPPGP